MAVNYVKFYRGTQAQYEASDKNRDTLYFITSSDSSFGSLYLGDKLISGGISDFFELEGILIEEVKDKELLVYDNESGNWINKSPQEAIGVFQGATSESQGKSGLVPPPGIGQQNAFLKGDGTWVEAQSVENYITSVNESHFQPVTEGVLNLNENLINSIDNKVDKKYSEVNGEQVSWSLLSPTQQNILDSIAYESGVVKIEAENIKNLDDWVTENRNSVQGLLSDSLFERIEELAISTSFKSLSDDFVVSSDENKTLSLAKNYLETSIYKAEIGELSELQRASDIPNSNLVQEINFINDRLKWHSMS